jgi:hypothetical protein
MRGSSIAVDLKTANLFAGGTKRKKAPHRVERGEPGTLDSKLGAHPSESRGSSYPLVRAVIKTFVGDEAGLRTQGGVADRCVGFKALAPVEAHCDRNP